MATALAVAVAAAGCGAPPSDPAPHVDAPAAPAGTSGRVRP
ncbi:hypothetical protein NKG94_05215 [Micromonospora sp. M12]